MFCADREMFDISEAVKIPYTDKTDDLGEILKNGHIKAGKGKQPFLLRISSEFIFRKRPLHQSVDFAEHFFGHASVKIFHRSRLLPHIFRIKVFSVFPRDL